MNKNTEMDTTKHTLITEDFLNRNGERMDDLYEKSFNIKEWILHRKNNVPVSRVIWNMTSHHITVLAFQEGKLDARIIGAKYVEEIVKVLRFCGYDSVADNFKY